MSLELIKWKPSDTYHGYSLRGLPEGRGKLVSEEYSYVGSFTEGLADGKGSCIYKNGDSFIGTYFRGQRVTGKFHYGNSTYVGGFEHNKFKGPGVITCGNDKFTGSFNDGMRNGSGIQKTSKFVLEGTWHNGLRHGTFKLVTSNIIKYSVYEMDVQLGPVSVRYLNHAEYLMFEGVHYDDVNEGTMTYIDGSRHVGKWVNNLKFGEFKFYYPNNEFSYIAEFYRNGELE